MQGHGLGQLGYRNESKSTTNASFATGCCIILKWLALAVLITRGRGSISPPPPGAGGFPGNQETTKVRPCEPSVYDHNNITSIEKNQANNATYHPKRVAFDHGIRNCSFPETDLPIIHPLFVGREKDMYQVLRKVAKAHIVNINGAPGFGKSTLVIHVGYEIFKNGNSVRYINVEDKVSSFMNQMHKKAMPEFSSKTTVHQAQKNSLIKFSRSSLSVSRSLNLTVRSKNDNLFEELQSWSETVKCTNILILDNCDDILASTFRHEFLSLINSLVIKSHFKLHIIIVSREKLLYLDSFDCWTVRELNQSASVQLLDTLAPAIDNESLTEAAELVEGCPLALKVIGQLLHIHGATLIQKMKKELFTVLDKVSVQEQRFRVIMDVAFNRLGVLKDCGYALSLFPGSFDERIGNTIIQKECLESYLQHSLLNDYLFAFNYRYKMHRLIIEYLQDKISVHENATFVARFRKYFEALLLTYAIKQELDDTEKYTLSLELHNLNYLKELLIFDIHSSPETLAVLAFLLDMKFIQLEQLHRYYTLYIKNIHEVCQLLNPQLCGQVYTNIVKHLYQQCKCETLTMYIKNFFVSPCMEYFQCEVVSYLQVLHTSGVLQLSDKELSYINLVVGTHCIGYTPIFFSHGFGVLFTASQSSLMVLGFHAHHTSFVGWVIVAICGSYEFVLYINEYNIKSAPQLRILEITSKWVCHYTIIIFIVIVIMHTLFKSILSLALGRFIWYAGPFFVMYCIAYIIHTCSIPQYCCRLIPLCV